MTYSTITSRGQTTLPVAVRRALDLKAGDRIIYEIQGDSVVVRPHSGAMAVFGSLKPPADKKDVPFKEARAVARDAWAKGAAKR